MYSRINMEIAICDDDELFNEIMSEKLSTVMNKNQIKYNITPFFNGSELITALNDPLNRFDVVFLDVDMPGVNGENVAQYINSSKASIPVIFVTNHDDFVFSSFKYRPFGFLRKSHVDSELEEAVIRLDNENAWPNSQMEKATLRNSSVSSNTRQYTYYTCKYFSGGGNRTVKTSDKTNSAECCFYGVGTLLQGYSTRYKVFCMNK